MHKSIAAFTVIAVLAAASLAAPAAGRRAARAGRGEGKAAASVTEIEGARAEIYRTVGDVSLRMFIFDPPGHSASNPRPAIVFFFGGGWVSGTPTQFENQCRYLASRGMVAMTVDYRVGARHGVKPVECVADAKAAIRWVRANAARLGVDPHRVAAGGGSAGGHLAAATAFTPDLEEKAEAKAGSCIPDALVLFNPALVLAPIEGLKLDGFVADLRRERFGTSPESISPAHHVASNAPPAIVFHGKSDTTVPYATVEAFASRMKAAGNRCEAVGYDGEQHGFFNFGRGGNRSFLDTLRKADEFLASLGWLKGEPTVGAFFAESGAGAPTAR